MIEVNKYLYSGAQPSALPTNNKNVSQKWKNQTNVSSCCRIDFTLFLQNWLIIFELVILTPTLGLLGEHLLVADPALGIFGSMNLILRVVIKISLMIWLRIRMLIYLLCNQYFRVIRGLKKMFSFPNPPYRTLLGRYLARIFPEYFPNISIKITIWLLQTF